jgi:hypothetical protein
MPASWRVTDCPDAREARVQVLVAEVKVTPEGRFGLETPVKPWAGRVSATLRLAASEGPELETTIVYVSDVPAVTEVTPSVLVIPRVARGLRLSESVAVTVEASEALAVAVLARVPVADDLMVAVTE